MSDMNYQKKQNLDANQPTWCKIPFYSHFTLQELFKQFVKTHQKGYLFFIYIEIL